MVFTVLYYSNAKFLTKKTVIRNPKKPMTNDDVAHALNRRVSSEVNVANGVLTYAIVCTDSTRATA